MYQSKHILLCRINKQLLLLMLTCILNVFVYANPINEQIKDTMPDKALLELSERFLYAVKTEDSISTLETELASLDMQRIINGLNNDDAVKTFWINLYNGWFQILAGREKMSRPGIFTKKVISIAGTSFSLDNIEHGILRKYRWKLSMGYLSKPFPGKLIKQLAVRKIDYRIHFALNCGAKSCPPIAFYSCNKINQQLDLAAKNFLRSETIINAEKKEVVTSKILSWFKGDFGGKKGIRKILEKEMGKDLTGYTIKFKKYDWDALLKNYSE
jgi:hypothetical protein